MILCSETGGAVKDGGEKWGAAIASGWARAELVR